MDRKLKILLLGYKDSKAAGHIGYSFEKLPNCYDKRMVTMVSLLKKEPYAFYCAKSLSYALYYFFKNIVFKISCFLRYGEFVKIDEDRKEYCFYSFDDKCVSANKILKKCNGFVPDVISIYWVGSFVSPKTIYDLYQATKAHIVILFVDEAPLAGGCHYHCDCDGYLSCCGNCPALKTGKKLAEYQMQNRIKYLSKIPLTIVGSPYDMQKASETQVFKNAKKIASCGCPKVIRYPKSEARSNFNISEKDFVVLLGAVDLKEKRKGLKYALDAINAFARQKYNVVVLLLGNNPIDETSLENVKVIQPGFLALNKMYAAYCSADVYLNTTIADSGPYMVNYAFALGVPVVSFNIGIAASLIEHKETGYISEYKNINSLKDGIDYIYGLSIQQREEMSQKEIKKITQYSNNYYWYDIILDKWKKQQLA